MILSKWIKQKRLIMGIKVFYELKKGELLHYEKAFEYEHIKHKGKRICP